MPRGSYYLRARVKGRIVRESLKTTDYRVARAKLGDRMRALRMMAGADDDSPATLADCIATVRARVATNPTIKATTRRAYLDEMDALRAGYPAAVPSGPLRLLGPDEMAAWWSRVARHYSPQRANHMLMFVKWAIKEAIETRAIASDPTAGLKRVHVPRTRLELLSKEQFRELVKSIRAQKGASNRQTGDWIEFMAYSGMRPAEIATLEWSDIDEKHGWITVTGGDAGTKNRENRRVPIFPQMAELLNRMRGDKLRTGKVFGPSRPTCALHAACRRLGYPHQRIYDLRHYFATNCCENGAPIPTLAQWLGHKDGGVLAMKVYIQKNDEHSRALAQRMTF